MRELKDELASLRIDREAPRRGRWRLPLVLHIVLGALAAGGWYFSKAHAVFPAFGAVEVETVQVTVETGNGPNAGTPILTASGYLVARKQSVVSSKIQGRIAKLLVEEGSVVKEGDVLATLDNADALAAIVKAKADIEYAKADLTEMQRQGGDLRAWTRYQLAKHGMLASWPASASGCSVERPSATTGFRG